MGRIEKNEKTLSFASFYRSCRPVKFTGVIPTDWCDKFRSWLSAADRWNPLEQPNPYISISDNLIIPVPYKKLVFAKIAVTGFAVILFIIASFLCSIVFAVILGYPLEMKEVGMAFGKLFVTGISCLIAVMPIIVLFTLKRNLFLAGTCGAFVYGFCGIFVADTHFTSWYPTTSGLTIINYNPNSLNYQMAVAISVLAVCLFFSLTVIFAVRKRHYD